MTSGIVTAIGGYDSVWFAILLVVCLLVGGMLSRIHWVFLALPLFGVALLTDWLSSIVASIPNPPWYVQAVPLLFVVVIIVTVFWTMNHSLRRGTDKSEQEAGKTPGTDYRRK